jgi:hypothetical protein
MSFPRKWESMKTKRWIPAFAGMTKHPNVIPAQAGIHLKSELALASKC